MDVVIYVGVALVVGVIASIVLPAFVGGAWSPTKMPRVRAMLQIARVQRHELVYDLGAGDGRVIVTAALEFGARAVGVEVDPLRSWLCEARIRVRGLRQRVSVRRANFFAVDLNDADVVTFYLSQAAADKLQAKFEAELKPGARVVSHGRPLADWTPSATDAAHRLYMYMVPEAFGQTGNTG